MTKFKIENVSEILKIYDFNKKSEIESDLLCLLCKKLLINAQISPCACRFCFDCISKYLYKDNKPCPGNTDDCKNEFLCLHENIFVDNAINIRISKLILKCPDESCEFEDELRNIENHIRIDHSEIGRLKIIVDKLGNENKMFKSEIDELKLDIGRNKISIETLEKKCDQQNEEQIKQFNKKYQELENKFVNANQERENKEKDLMRNEIDEMKNKQTETRTMSNRIDQTMKSVENKLLEIEINQNKMNYGEFVWRIDKINDKMKDAKNGIYKSIYSDSFYTHKHGYKMCLRVDPDGLMYGSEGTHLSVYFCLIKGEFDDILQWPFKYEVTFSLVDQQTSHAHVSQTVTYDGLSNSKDLKKPINERNEEMGFDKFIRLQELSSNATLTRNNQIFIKCSVNISS